MQLQFLLDIRAVYFAGQGKRSIHLSDRPIFRGFLMHAILFVNKVDE